MNKKGIFQLYNVNILGRQCFMVFLDIEHTRHSIKKQSPPYLPQIPHHLVPYPVLEMKAELIWILKVDNIFFSSLLYVILFI